MLAHLSSTTFYPNLINTVVMTIILGLAYFFVRRILAKKSTSEKHRQRVQARAFYIVAAIYVMFFARIWIEGFAHLFTVLGIVSAALVVTNKEVIMNFTGWLIISWRGLFSEGDYIKVQTQGGYVVHLGPLYFTLTTRKSPNRQQPLGQLVRIPNGIVINNPLINYSQTGTPHEHVIELTIDANTNYLSVKATLLHTIRAILREQTEHYFHTKKLSHDDILLRERIYRSAHVSFTIPNDKPDKLNVKIKFECFFSTLEEIENAFWERYVAHVINLKTPEMKIERVPIDV